MIKRKSALNALWVNVFLFFNSLSADPGLGPLTFGNASGEPGQVVGIEVHLRSVYPIGAYTIAFHFDASRLYPTGFDLDGAPASEVNPFGVGFKVFFPEHGLALEFLSDSSGTTPIPASESIYLGKLLFRVRAEAEEGVAIVEPVAAIANGVGNSTNVVIDLSPDETAVVPVPLVPGEIMVLPPSGPRPVGDLQCKQFLDRVEGSFQLVEEYDAIEVTRGEVLLQIFPGDATEFQDPTPPRGNVAYGVSGRSGNKRSVIVTCEVDIGTPAAPPVLELNCDKGVLNWKNPLVYDKLLVLRNEDSLASLPGGAQVFEDPERSDELVVYSVIGEFEGFQSAAVSCIANGKWIMEAGDVRVPLGSERVLVPIFVTTTRSVHSLDAFLSLDVTQLELIPDRAAALKDTVGFPEPEFFGMVSDSFETHMPAGAVGYDLFPPRNPEKDLPVGIRQHVMTFPFKPLGTFVDGQTFKVGFVKCVPPITTCSDFAVGEATASELPTVLIPGRIRFGNGGPEAVNNLSASTEVPGDGAGAQAGPTHSKTVVLRWTNGQSYDALRLERNGELLAELPSGSTEYRDKQLEGNVYTYKVIGVVEDKESFPTRVLVSTVTAPGTFLRGDANRDGTIGIADPVATLTYLFLGSEPLPCDDAADADDDGKLSIADAIVTLSYLFLGTAVIRAPGTEYPWFDPTPDELGCRS